MASRKLTLAARLVALVGIILLMFSNSNGTQAHEPYLYTGSTIDSWGADSIITNWNNGWAWPNSNTRYIPVNDYYGFPSAVKNSQYYPDEDYVWNHDDNPHTWIRADLPAQPDGTFIELHPHPGVNPPDEPEKTHIHLFRWAWGGGYWYTVEDNLLKYGSAAEGYVHVRALTATCTPYPDCPAAVMAHEVGHALGLRDEFNTHTTIMNPPPGDPIQKSEYWDRRMAELCIPVVWTIPC